MAKLIYLDHCSTTPTDPRVCAVMTPYFCGTFGNPSSTHGPGVKAKAAVEKARKQVADLIGAKPSEIIWTSGATESNNLAIRGTAEALGPQGKRHIVTAATEHKAVLESCKALAAKGFDVTILPVGKCGLVDLELLYESIRPDTALVSLMSGNNEVGILQDIETIGAICSDKGVLFHVDAAQTAGKVAMDMDDLCIDLLSISAHKFYGPKGVGALYVRGGTDCEIVSQISGGGQEGDLRSGTLNVPGIVGIGAAAALAEGDDTSNHRALRDLLLRRLRQGLGHIEETCPGSPRLDGLLHVFLPGVCTHSLIGELSEQVAFSKGSACTLGKESYTLAAMGFDEDYSKGAARFMVGRGNTESEIERAAECIVMAVKKMREQSPSVGSELELEPAPDGEVVDEGRISGTHEGNEWVLGWRVALLDDRETYSAQVTLPVVNVMAWAEVDTSDDLDEARDMAKNYILDRDGKIASWP